MCDYMTVCSETSALTVPFLTHRLGHSLFAAHIEVGAFAFDDHQGGCHSQRGREQAMIACAFLRNHIDSLIQSAGRKGVLVEAGITSLVSHSKTNIQVDKMPFSYYHKVIQSHECQTQVVIGALGHLAWLVNPSPYSRSDSHFRCPTII